MTLAARLTYTGARMESLNNTITRYAEQATKLEQLISTISPELIIRQPEETRWSVLEIVCHLADAELLASARIRRIITQDRPNLWGYQQEQWATALGYRHRRIEMVLARFALLRRENAELIEGLAEEIWQQTGAHDVYGTLSLEQLIEDYLTHTTKHLDQIGSVRLKSPAEPTMKGKVMAKTQEETKEPKNAKSKDEKESKEAKGSKGKDGKVLMKRVKKAIKRSRRKLSEEKFEKELQRTISFLEELQQRINQPPANEPAMAVEPNQPSRKKSKDKSGNGKAKGKHKPMTEVQVTVGAQSDPSVTGK